MALGVAVVCLSVACGGESDVGSGNTGGTGGAAGAAGMGGSQDFVPFFNGVDLSEFQLVGIPASELAVVDGVIECACQTNGYLYKEQVYENFELALQFRFERPSDLASGDDASFFGNSGYFVYLSPPHEIWPPCLEVQGSYPETGDIFRLPGLLPGNDAPDLAALAQAKRPVGEWNDLIIVSQDGALDVELNGVQVNHSEPSELREGLIALESEGAEIHWRDIRIKQLP
jgi:hypothetical protein